MEPQQIITPTPLNKRSRRTKLALWLMIGPTALIVGAFTLFAIVNLFFFSTAEASNLLFPQDSAFETFLTILLYVSGLIGFLAWLPGIIVGIVLLATRK